ncbi:signal peptidase I [Alkaliphilus sp. MSJ-5]|uniref:Signal peptidase I n=1 Tax=Alkaliphilus flagellatus TaxID=2841507 RepID=A0ABS6G3H1_9FIRM|nr:signal peptidase I [Alkaliphilus flagellatus]MBU5677033.1 signal peptidase I [Alkaliphilus flagellatus]
MKNEIIEWIKTIILSLVIALIITTFVKPTIVKNYSMSPTLQENDFLIINRFLYKRSAPKRGDIVVFQSNLKTDNGKDKLLIKRVIAVPGDEMIIKEGQVYVNGTMLEEDYIPETYTEGDIDIIVPENKVFVMGDNRGNSMDSRDEILGLVDFDVIMGKAFVRLFPFNKIGLLK